MKCEATRNSVRTDARILPAYTRKDEEILYFASVLEYFQPADYAGLGSRGGLPAPDLDSAEQASVETDFRAVHRFLDSMDANQLRTLLLMGEPVDPGHSVPTAIDRVLELKRKRWRVVSKAYSELRVKISQLD